MHTIEIQIAPPYRQVVEAALLARAAKSTLEQQNAPPSALSIVITDEAAVQHLNARHRGVNAPTDVLSFEDGSIDPETNLPYLGDIVIAYPRAETQAREGGHPVAWELCLLTVHGVLHLLGHDHATLEEKARMWAAQRTILESLNCPLSPP